MKKFLIIVDMQNDFITGSLGTPEAQAILPRVVKHIEETPEDVKIIFTQDTHMKNYLDTAEGKKLPIEHCIRGTVGWEIPGVLTNGLDKPFIFEKPTFGSLELMDYLYDHIGKDQDAEIEFCGLCTDICVVSNVLLAKAHFPEAKIVVNSSLCAGATPETHEAALTTMKMCQIDVI